MNIKQIRTQRKEGEIFTILDVIERGYALEPMRCINPGCKDEDDNIINLMNSCGDCVCEWCGELQNKFLTKARIAYLKK